MEADPRGYELARETMDELYPDLRYVATGSVGGSVGRFPVDSKISQHQLTRAFLSSVGMEHGSFGARVVESQHTNVWRKACREIVRFLDDHPEHAAPGSEGLKNPDFAHYSSAGEYASKHDRNLFLYMMTEMGVALGVEKDEFTPLWMWREVCGHGGYRVPVPEEFYETYDYDDEDLDIEHFYPLVGYGSLRTLQSQLMGELPNDICAQWKDHFPEDLAFQIVCNGLGKVPPGDFLTRMPSYRSHFAAVTVQRRYCGYDQDISIEDAVGKPPMFSNGLTDTSESFSDQNDFDDLVASKWNRGEENVDQRYAEVNMRSLVYVTSSHWKNTPPGIYRLLDLPVFSKLPCVNMRNVVCGYNRALYGSPRVVLNADAALWKSESFVDAGSGAHHVTGRYVIASTRCRPGIASPAGYLPPCESGPYDFVPSSKGCSVGSLPLLSRPSLYSSTHWDHMLIAPPPPLPSAPPSPPITPPPCPPGSPPLPPPSPPYVMPERALLALVRQWEERACASVFWRSTAERCERLGVDLTQRIEWLAMSPPLPPPRPPFDEPPPPLPPPSPAIPTGLVPGPIASAVLSTVRTPATYATTPEATGELAYDGYVMHPDDGAANTGAFNARAAGDRTQCIDGATPHVGMMPCVSAVVAASCLPGVRACSADPGENGRDPFLELTVAAGAGSTTPGHPADRHRYLHSLIIRLPKTLELANLLFASGEGSAVNGTGFRINLYGGSGEPIAHNYVETVSAPPDNREFAIPLASGVVSDDLLIGLGEVVFVRITLPGQFRQIWFKDVALVERDYSEVDIAPRPPSAPPPPP
jgi:hypothetical protein